MSSPEILIVYSSRKTGNSKKLAEAIYKKLDVKAVISSIEQAPAPDKFNYVILGFGVYHGWPDDLMREYMTKCNNQPVGLFMTLGAWPDSNHAAIAIGRAEGLLSSSKVTAKYICHGQLDDDLIARLNKLPPTSPHAMTTERKTRIKAAASHPDENDAVEAAKIFNLAYRANFKSI
jgi:hypothetical protein